MYRIADSFEELKNEVQKTKNMKSVPVPVLG